MWSNMTIEEFREICATLGKDAAYAEIARRATPMECMSVVAARHRKETVEKVAALAAEYYGGNAESEASFGHEGEPSRGDIDLESKSESGVDQLIDEVEAEIEGEENAFICVDGEEEDASDESSLPESSCVDYSNLSRIIDQLIVDQDAFFDKEINPYLESLFIDPVDRSMQRDYIANLLDTFGLSADDKDFFMQLIAEAYELKAE